MKTTLFNKTLTDGHSWRTCWNSEDTFLPFLKYVYEANHIKYGDTFSPKKIANSVFRIGGTVIKLFCPPEAKIEDEREYNTELEALKFCKNAGVLTPETICTGTVYDTLYSFPYVVMNFIDGVESLKAIPAYSTSEKVEFAEELKEIASKIHAPTNINIPHYDDPVKIDGLWRFMSESFREDRKQYLSSVKFPELVFSHGDLGHRNIIIDKQGRLNLIDFSESLIAPYYYDWSFIYNDDDFCNDPVIMKAYFGDYKNDDFYETQTIAWLINWFGAVFIDWRSKEMGIDFKNITNVAALKNLIIKLLNR